MGRVIVEDTRQQAGKHAEKHEWWADHGLTLVRSKLPFGDYCLPAEVAVDTKQSIQELAMDIDRDHARFRRELVGARDAGVRLVVLVENGDGVTSLEDLAGWVEPAGDYAKRLHAKRRITGERLAKACTTMAARYGVEFRFCSPAESAGIVADLLLGDGWEEDRE